MNRIYRTLWSAATQSWQAVPETAKTAGKKSKSAAGGVIASVALSFSLTGGANAQSPPAINQLPTGGSVVRGTATIQQTATAQAAAMTVNQTSQRAVVNWNTFNIGSAASVNFVQPNAQAVTLNRVNDSNPSQIFGRMTSNGQVVLTNANGIYFAPGSSVDVGAITATTHSITDDNLMSGKYVFERNGATGKVVNEGRITSALGGYVALLAPEVQNAGVVVARAGTVAMAAGETITLNIDGAGSLAGITTTPSAIATLIENKQAVRAPDGQIILSAMALNKLQAGVIKNSGSLEANSLVSKGGKIYLEGDDITLSNTSRLEAKGPTGGGTVLVGGDWQGSGDLRQATKVTMEAGAAIDASATDKGDGGKVVLWSDVHNADSVTTVHGSIKAEAGANGGDGGQIETSGHVLNVDGIGISAQSTNGKVGEWLLDPYNVYIMKDVTTSDETLASGTYTPSKYASYIKSSEVNTALGSANVTVTTVGATTGTATGNIYVYDGLAYSANKLTLNASNNIYVYFPINVTGTGSLAFEYGQSGGASTAYYINAPVNLPTGQSFSTKLGTNAVKTFTVINDLGAQADVTTTPATMTLQGVAKSIAATDYYALGSNINAADTSTWTTLVSGYKYFIPIGYGTKLFNGIFDGLGHSISNLKVSYTGSTSGYSAGFFGTIAQPTIKNFALLNEDISGGMYVRTGGVYGNDSNSGFTLSNVYTSGSVYGIYSGVGGIGGSAGNGSISNVSSSANVSTSYTFSGYNFQVGGLFGNSQVNITNAAYYGTVTANSNKYAGGIQGDGRNSVVTSTYYDSTKNSGLLGIGTTTTTVTGTVTGLTTANLSVQSNFSGFDFVNFWAMGPSYPLPQFMVSNILRVVPSSPTVVYGNTPTSTLSYVGLLNNDTTATAFTGGVLPTATVPANLNVGSYPFSASGGTAPSYFVVDDPATSTITPKPLTISGLSVTTTKVYNNSTAAATSGSGSITFLATEAKGAGSDTDGKPYEAVTVTGTAIAAYNSKDVATANTITYTSGLTLSSSNYSINYSIAGTITPKPLNASGLTLTATKFYDATNTAAVTGTSGITGGAATSSSTDGKYFSTDTVTYTQSATPTPTATYSQSNVGTGLTITYSGLGTLGGASVSNYSLSTTASVAGAINKATLSLTGSQVYNGTTTFLGSNLIATGVAGQTFALTGSNATLTSADVTATPVSKSFTGITLGVSSNGGLVGNYNAIGATANVNISITPATAKFIASKVYDGSQDLTGSQLTVTGVTVSGTTQTLSFSGTPTLYDTNVATANNYVITSGVTLTNGTGLASNYVLPSSSYSLNNSATLSRATAIVNASKTYSGDTSLLAGQVSITGVSIGGVAEVLDFTGTASLSNANVATSNKYVVTSGMTLANGSTGLASNYSLPSGAYSATRNTATINPLVLTLTVGTDISAASSVYGNSLTVGAVSFANKVVGDDVNAVVTVTEPAASRSTGLKLKVGDYFQSASTNLTGAQAGNYSFAGITSSSANYTVSQRALTGTSIAAGTSVYGSALAPGAVTFSNVVAGDLVSSTAAVNTNTVSHSSNPVIGDYTQTTTGLTGADATNYSLSTAFTSAQNYTISKKSLMVSVPGATKVYDGSNTIYPTGPATITGVVSNADDVQITAGNVTGFVDKNVGTNKAVTYNGFALSGTDANNYLLPLNPASTADITAKTISVAGLSAPASRVYDGTLSAVASGPAVLLSAQAVGQGSSTDGTPYAGDVIGFTGTATGSYNSKDVATANTVTFSGLASNNSNYVLSFGTQAATITAKSLNVSGLSTAASRVYDTSQTAVVTAAPALQSAQAAGAGNSTDGTPYVGDSIGFNGTASGNYNSKDVAVANSVTFGGLTSNNSNYTFNLGSQSSTITPKALTVSGLSAPASRTYDGTTVAAVSGTPALLSVQVASSGNSSDGVPYAGDVVGFNGSATGSYNTKDVSTANTITFGGITSNNSNYTLSFGSQAAAITPKTLTVSGLSAAASRVYDATLVASVSGTPTLQAAEAAGAGTTSDGRIYTGDSVNLNGTMAGTYNSKDVSSANSVSFGGLTSSNNNYILSFGSQAATITTKAVTVSGLLAPASRVYDATQTASVSGTPTLQNAEAPGAGTNNDGKPYTVDALSLNGTATGSYNSKNVGTANLVTFAGLTSSNDNYTVSLGTQAAAITRADLALTGVTVQNKTYDATRTATLTGTPSVNALSGDVVTVNASGASGLFVDKNAGTGKIVTASGFTVGGADAANYTLQQPTGLSADITKADLQVTGITTQNKVYDATRNATLNGTASITALAGDVVNLDGTGSGLFADKNVGTGKPITVSGYSINGADATNYTLQQPAGLSADITRASLSMSGITAANKTYDGTTSATVSTTNALKTGLFADDVVDITATGSFATKTVANGKLVTLVSSYSGADVGNYLITDQTSANADITAKALGLSIPGASRVYDGSTVISPSGPVTLSGIVGVDQVNLGVGNVTGYVNKNVGTNKTVTYAGLALSGSEAGNYTLPANPTSNASITPAALSISGITAADKTYDAGTTATVSTSNVVKTGLIGNDVVNVAATGSFVDKNAGTGKTVNLSSSYSGTDAGNYSITDQATTTADISKAPLTVTAANAVKNLGDANPALTVALTGFVGGETLATSGVTGTGLATTTATVSTDAGTAVITAAVGTLASSNYAFTQVVDGTLTIRPISALNNNEVATLIGAQLASLSGAQVGSFSASQLQVFSPQQLNALSPSQLAGLTTLQLLSLSPVQMAAISPAKIALMTAAELVALSDAQLQALTPTQLAAIAPANFAEFTPAQIMAMSIAQVQNLSPEQLATFSPAQIASLSAAELAYFDARQLAAIGIFPKVESRNKFEAPIPVMTEVATSNLPPSTAATPTAMQAAAPVQAPALSPRSLQALLFSPNAESATRTGVLAITILNSAQAKPTTAGIAFEQDADTVSLRFTSAPALVPAISDKVVFSDKLITFMVATPTGEMVEFQGSLVNNRMVIVAPSPAAKRVARTEMNLVLAAAVTSLGKESRVMLAKLDGVVLDLR